MADARLDAVEGFYDFHPINARQILDAVAARGIAREAITEEVLQQHDQDHYGGTAATDRLIAEAAVQAGDVVLDVCSGMGGHARYLAWKTGCEVTGLDLTASRVEGATDLTRVAGLADRVRFVHGNALDMPFPDGSFTLAIAQEAFAHIPDKARLVAQCARVLRPGGRLVCASRARALRALRPRLCALRRAVSQRRARGGARPRGQGALIAGKRRA